MMVADQEGVAPLTNSWQVGTRQQLLCDGRHSCCPQQQALLRLAAVGSATASIRP